MGCLCRTLREESLATPREFAKRSPRNIVRPHLRVPETPPALALFTSHARAGFSFWRMTRGFASLPLTERAPAFAGQGSLWLLSVASLFGGRFTPRRRQLAEVTRNKQRGSRAGVSRAQRSSLAEALTAD